MNKIKKVFFGMATLLIIGVAAYNVVIANRTTTTLTGVCLANVEALSSIEFIMTEVYCYSQSQSINGASYWDCGDCCRYENKRGQGDASSCIPVSTTLCDEED
jgi:hypothetical protein